MKICFFGGYDPYYSRNKILIDGIRQNGPGVVHCRSVKTFFIPRYLELIFNFRHVQKNTDYIFCAFVGQRDVPLAWLLARFFGKKLIFDAFYSMYDTYVYDRQSAKPVSLRAIVFWITDWVALHLSDVVLSDTQSHANYIAQMFHVSPHKIHPVFVGGDDRVFKRSPKKSHRQRIIVEFHGMFTRLAGAEYFIQAAKQLENDKRFEFWLIGDSRVYSYPKEILNRLQPKNLRVYPAQSLPKLAYLVQSADVSIGHLGLTKKARSVISNKTYQALACGNALIVLNTPANHELLHANNEALFVTAGSVSDLVDKIVMLFNAKLRKKLSDNAYALHHDKLINARIGERFLQVIHQLV